VVDATSDIDITVTEADCRKGVARDHTKCPGALAAGRGYDGAIIAKRSAYIIKGRTAVRYRVPEGLTREEVAIDRGGSFRPGTFTLKKPGKGEQLATGDNAKTGPHKKKSKAARPSFTPHFTEGMRTALGSRIHIS
jgi:hypothetical protein